MSNELENLKDEIQSCDKCNLRVNTNIPCWDTGNIESKIMFVAEALGIEEQKIGVPLVGRSGRYFNRCLMAIGIKRSEVFCTNTVMCRPIEKSTNKDRAPTEAEIEVCSIYLLKQIELIKPSLIVTLGRVAFKTLTDCSDPIMKAKGNIYRYKNDIDIRVFPLMHPSYIISYGKEGIIESNWKDWQKLKELWHEYNI